MSDSDFSTYHNYLKRESFLGFIYRRLLLYPFLRFLLGPFFLDVGCGLGIFLSYGFKRKCLGLDVNPYNVDYIRSNGFNAKLIKPGHPFPVDNLSFPACIIDQVLEHVEDPSFLILEIYKSLCSDGKLVIGLPCLKGFHADPDHKVFYDKESIVSTVSSIANFTYVRSFYFPFNLRFVGRYLSYNYLYVVFRKRSY